MTQKADIPSFFLFGEPLRTVEGKFLHLEALDDRSRPNDWNIRAHAHADLNHVFHITSGGGVMHAEDQVAAFAAPCLLLVPSGVVHGFAWEAETTGSVLTLADSYLRDLATREPDFSSLFKAPCQLPLAATSGWGRRSETCRANWSGPRPAAAPRSRLTCWPSWSRLCGCRSTPRRPARRSTAPRPDWWRAFASWSRSTIARPLAVEDYADRLGVTVGQLRAACRKIAAVSPLRLLQERAILEAKRALLYSNMTDRRGRLSSGFRGPGLFFAFLRQGRGRVTSSISSRALGRGHKHAGGQLIGVKRSSATSGRSLSPSSNA
jgi:AraC family transcriptional activator of pobA